MAIVEPLTTAQHQDALRKQQEDAAARETKRRADAKDQLSKDAERRATVNAQAANVMDNSRPTPTQAENDQAKLGILNPDDKEDPKNPEMPPLHQQQARTVEAGGAAPYSTRDAAATTKPAKKPE